MQHSLTHIWSTTRASTPPNHRRIGDHVLLHTAPPPPENKK